MERGAVEHGQGRSGGTSAGAARLEAVRAARAAVEQVADLAVSPTPEVLDRTALLLQSAIASLTAARERSATTPGGARQAGEPEELNQVRRAIHRADALLCKARQYHTGWSACLGARTGGYQAGGQPALPERPSRFRAEG